MPRGKLILICQSGGDFVTSDDGHLSYTGGEAHALDINHETLFDDLKLKLAEMCNLEYKSLSMKYFLPGNRRTLITLSNDKDLKRMHDFYADLVTADVFVMGREGFDHEAFYKQASRSHGIKVAETVTAPVSSQISATTPVATDSTTTPIRATPSVVPSSVAHGSVPLSSSNSVMAVHATAQSPTKVATTSKYSPAYTGASNPKTTSLHQSDHIAVAASATAQSPIRFEMDDTPADTVKKRRRTASWKIGADGPVIVAVADDVGVTKKGTSRKKNNWTAVADDMEMQTVQSDDVGEKRKGSSRKTKAWNYNVAAVAGYGVEQPEHPNIVPLIDMSHFSPIDSGPKDGSLDQMVVCWKNGITGVGQEFKSVVEFRDVLQKYAIAHRFAYRFKKNDTNRATGICVAEGCPWKIHASWVPSEEVFRIKKMDKTHTCGGESWKAAHPTKSWLVNIIKDRLRQSPHHKPKDIANGIFQDFGIELNYTQVWRGMEDAREQLQGSYKEAYNQLPWFCAKMVEANPGSSAKLFIGDDSKFQRLFVSFYASVYGFQYGCRPLLFLDSTKLKSKYHEILLIATALDGNDGLFPVSFAMVDIENGDNWHWFLEELRSTISSSRSITFVSDKEKGLMKSVLDVFENAHHGYSIYHLLENFKRNFKGPFHGDGKGSLPICLLAAAHAVRLDGFRMFTEQIKMVSSKAYDWLMQVEPEYWTNALFMGERYNHITVDVAELYLTWVEEVQELPIIQKVEALRCKIMELMYTRQMDSNGWTAKLTPSKEQKLREESIKSRDLKVLFSSDTIFEVHDNDSINVVDIDKWDCSCLGWKVTGLPCHHAIAVFNSTGRSMYDYCSRYFTVNSFRLIYSKSINPVLAIFKPLGEEEEAVSEARHVLPPTTPRLSSEQKEKRNRKQGEVKRMLSCSRCKGEGHNKVTCKETL